MSVPRLTETVIRQGATSESYRRGEEYYANAAVGDLALRGNVLEAEVEGSQYQPYAVRITFDAGGIVAATCSCPYGWGGWCKHIVAALLAYLHEPDQVEVRPPVQELLDGLSRDQLHALVVYLAEQDPSLMDAIESRVESWRGLALPVAAGGAPAVVQPSASPGPRPSAGPTGVREGAQPAAEAAVRRTSVDPLPFRRQVQRALSSLDHMRSSEAYWHVGEVADKISDLVDQAWDFIKAGDGRNALVILEAITDEYVNGWVGLDDSDGEASSLFSELDRPWTEAILTADLTPAERTQWQSRLAEWQAELDNYSINDVFAAASLACELGWDDPHFQRASRGEISPPGAELRRPSRAPEREEPKEWDEDEDEERDDGEEWDEDEEEEWDEDEDDWSEMEIELTQARLAILERQGRIEEYLNLASASGLQLSYLIMLVKLGRTGEAVDQGLRSLLVASAAFELAKALREQGDLAAALRIAEHGLTLSPDQNKSALASWTSDLASGLGDEATALRTALIAFKEYPTLAAYLKVKERAGATWPTLRTETLETVRGLASAGSEAKIEIFLHEGLLDDAIAAVGDYTPYGILERLADAAVEHRPDWVIQLARGQADRIMDAGKADRYDYAVNWLGRARAAYRAAGREAEWRACLTAIRTRHGRKYKLMALLDRFGK